MSAESEVVLISTHDLDAAGALRSAFEEEGYEVDLVTPDEEIAHRRDAGLLILTGGAAESEDDLVSQAREKPRVPVFAFVSGDDEARRQAALRIGLDEAFDPEAGTDEVLLLGSRVLERRRLQRITGIVGETEPIHEALERVVQIAPADATVLVTGESGTGKELVARGIHALSPRRHKSFIAVNVAALSETLLESELFGHEKGAFTGAVDSRRGFFELAHGGTIFLDEIGEMPLATQTKLLRVLEQREFLRVGGEKPIHVDVRVIAATNQRLRELVAIGDFRRDLYYRLNVLTIELPPLRERTEDIPLLVETFIDEMVDRNDRPFKGIAPQAMELLKEHRWPGNVRELRNLVESMVVLAPGREIMPADIPEEIRSPEKGRSLLPVHVPQGPPPRKGEADEEEAGPYRPELEFVFRTLVELRVDMDELRREFDAYRRELEEARDVGRLAPVRVREGDELQVPVGIVEDAAGPPPSGLEEEPGVSGSTPAEPPEEKEEGDGADGVVVFQPGMTMEDLEREAIRAALEEVDGNRRKAAEALGIGERTLYRKIRKFDLA